MSTAVEGWLLDLYPDPQGGLAVWLIEDGRAAGKGEKEEDGAGPAAARRLRLKQPFPVTFYIAGPEKELRKAWKHLQGQARRVALSRTERGELFQARPVTTLAVQVQEPAQQPGLFASIAAEFPGLTYYDADVSIALRHAAVYSTFPLAKVQAQVDEQGMIQKLQTLDKPWDIEAALAPLRVMRIEPDCDPRHGAPQALSVTCSTCTESGRRSYQFPLQPGRPLLVNLAAVMRRFDPDLLLTAWGDTWLLPNLLQLSDELGLPLPLNRDQGMSVIHKPERSYQAYGQVIYRGQQVHLWGRWHIDMYNAMMFHDYGLEGILESARVTAMPVQQAARLSPGTGISSMQIITALRQGVLVPWHKQQAETPKTALDLLHADQGGLVYQPIVGLHRDVAEIDFVSMYPSIMAYFNVSPETVGNAGQESLDEGQRFQQVPELNLWIDQQTDGLVPQTLRPLLEKRIALKEKMAMLPGWDPRKGVYKARASAHKWLLVTCFGYLGYKNARFGRIEAHQAVTAYSRECLLRAKEAAEEAGYEVLHMYVDGLWVKKEGCKSTQDVQPLLDEIAKRTHLPIALEGIYRWVVFLPSRVDDGVPVANRYFGVYQDGSLKVRGIEARRRDTPPFIAQTQMEALECLAKAPDASQLPALLPEVLNFLRQQLRRLRLRRLPLEELLVTQKLSRELSLYRSPSAAARAAAQLARIGKTTRPGQAVRFLYTRGEPGVQAWDVPPPASPDCLDIAYYTELFLRAAATLLQPLGFTQETLKDRLLNNASYVVMPGRLPLWPDNRLLGRRREWDSNPRWLSPHLFSRQAPSSARSSLQVEKILP